MVTLSTTDYVVIGTTLTLGTAYLLRDNLFSASKPTPVIKSAALDNDTNPRDFIAKLKASVCSRP